MKKSKMLFESYITYLNEKASIDWNNYLTPEEVKQFLSKDDKVESAENIIYSNDFKPRYKDLHNDLQKKYNNSYTKNELVKSLVDFYEGGHLLTEGIHLVAYVKSPYEFGTKIIEDNDYPSKKAFSDDLKANEYKVVSVFDNRDLYVADHSDYGKLSQLKKDLLNIKKWYEEEKSKNPSTTLWKDDYEKLKKIYDEAIKQKL